jgi:pyruvate/oxaloacetate carboxyltransferase
MSQEPVTFNCTVLRDGHQSLAATRLSTAQILPTLEPLDRAGFGCLETWGGATIDSGLRFLKEFPFDRLDAIRAKTKTPHMMLLRGQNIVAYAHQPDDVVTAFVTKAVKHGMNILRIFDALNDPRNMRCAIEATKKAGGHAQGTICYTKSPVHTVEAFIQLGCELAEMGCDSVVIKDMAGLIPPAKAAAIIAGLKKSIKVPVWLHTHDTAGIAGATYIAAIDAGVDAIDTSIFPFANGTAQPDTKRMLNMLEDHPRRPQHFDEDLLMELRQLFTPLYEQLKDYTSHSNEVVDSDAMTFEVPGGMLSNFRGQLKELKMEDKFHEVFAEIPVVREALGWIPLVTPTSQIVGTQAVMNVKFGRWKNFIPGAMDIALGYFGRTPAPVNPEIQKLAAEKSKKDPITERPADLKQPNLANLKKQLKEKGLPDDEEHAVIYAMFPAQLEEYYAGRAKGEKPVEIATAAKPAAAKPAATPAAPSQPPIPGAVGAPYGPRKMALTIDGQRHQVVVEEIG